MLATTSFPSSDYSNPYLIAAQHRADELYYKLKAAYTKVVGSAGAFVKPVFFAAVNGLFADMDTLPVKGKAGNAPFAQVGMRYGGENGRHFANRQFTK